MDTIPRIFIAYSREDELLLSKLKTHLTPLERSGQVEFWYDGKIEPGLVWEQTIKDELQTADIIIMLVSASAIASDYFYDKELKNALERHKSGEARVVPLILRPCAWMATPLGELQALPKNGKPVTSWTDPDAAFSDAVNSLWAMIKKHHSKLRKKELQRQRVLAKEHSKKTKSTFASTYQNNLPKKSKVNNLIRRPIFWGSALLVLASFFIFKVFNPTENPNKAILTYQKLLKEAKDSLKTEKISIAKIKFEEAKNFAKKNELDTSDADKGLKSCNEFAQNREGEYNTWKKKGDLAFNSGNYELAKDSYNKAAKFINNDEIKKLIQNCKNELTATKNQKNIISNIENNMIYLPAGPITMGCPPGPDTNCRGRKNIRKVNLRPFKLSKYEVTQAEWKAIMGQNPARNNNCDRCPVENVSWNDAHSFIKKLNQKSGNRYRLPSEAEWEYAARARENYNYAGSNNVGEVAWYKNNSGDKTHPVGQKAKNKFGLYDMTGNVWEWCQDNWNNFNGGPYDGSPYEKDGERIIRGGAFNTDGTHCYVDRRSDDPVTFRNRYIGFRLAQSN